jgi:hypothetical protein
MLQENLKPKKSTCTAAVDDCHETLDSKPYNSKKAEKIQNKTQPLPKHLIHYSDTKKKNPMPYGLQQSDLSQ